MLFLILCAFLCSGCFLDTLLFTSPIPIVSFQFSHSNDLAIIYNMPVITRSQTRALAATPVGLSVPSSNITNNLSGVSTSSTTTSITILSASPYHNDICLPATITCSTLPLSPLSSLDQMSFISNQHTLEFSNLPNSSNFEILEYCQPSLPIHNSSVLPVVKMESDCEEQPMNSSSTPNLEDVTRLLQSLS
jgi:hypothetical protein